MRGFRPSRLTCSPPRPNEATGRSSEPVSLMSSACANQRIGLQTWSIKGRTTVERGTRRANASRFQYFDIDNDCMAVRSSIICLTAAV